MRKYCDEIAQVCHEIVEAGYHAGIIDEAELKEFEDDCFVKVKVEKPGQDYVPEKSLEHVTA